MGSLTFCSSINKFCFWRTCIKNDKSKENQWINFHKSKSYIDLQDLFKISFDVIYRNYVDTFWQRAIYIYNEFENGVCQIGADNTVGLFIHVPRYSHLISIYMMRDREKERESK
jgi:hypothetical protein